MDRKALDCKMFSVAVFRNVSQDHIVNSLWRLLDDWTEKPVSEFIEQYSIFVMHFTGKI